jgi:zinc protease
MRIKTLGLGTVVAALLTGSLPAATPNFTKTVLPNGLTVIVREDHSAPVVSAQVWCRAGSIHEDRWLGAGLSHVLEHMLFKGTATRGVAGIAQEVEANGGYINAYTTHDRTVYHIDIPSKNWRTAVDILADCMMNATIPEAELLKEKQVIHREMAMNQDDPGRRIHWTLWQTAYTTHPYRYPVIGYPDIYDRTTRDDVVAYYKKNYVPNNLTFVVVGAVNAAEVIATIRDLTKNFRMNAVAPVAIPAEPPQLSRRERHETAPLQISHLRLAWHIPSLTDPDTPALDVLGIILGSGNSSRLYRQVQQKQGLVTSISAGAYTPSDPGLFLVAATSEPGNRSAATDAILEEIKQLATNKITDAECRKAVKKSLTAHYDNLKTMENQAGDLAYSDLLVGDPGYSEKYLKDLRRVTPADLQRVAAKYLTDNNLTIVTLSPPAGTAKETQTTAVAPAGIQIQKFTLPNGLRLLVREDTKLPLVDVKAMFRGGLLAETDANNGITKLMSELLDKGTATRTAEQIADAIESVGGSLGTEAGNNSFNVSARAMSDDLDLVLDILADVVLHPTFPEDKLVRAREEQLAALKAEHDELFGVGRDAMRQAMFAGHPYRFNILGSPETLHKLTRADLIAFHKQSLVPSNIVVAVFGNVHAEDVRKKIETRFGKMPAAKSPLPALAADRLAGNLRKTLTMDREQSLLLIGYSGTDIFNTNRFALALLHEACSGQGSRLFLRLRDELGLCYYCGASQLVGVNPGYFLFYVGTTPQKVALCEKEIFAEIAKMENNGLTAEELERAKNSIIGQRLVKMQDNAELAAMSGLDELFGLGYDFYKTMDDKYRAVTLDDIKRILNIYFTGKPHAVISVGPAAKEK